MSPTTLVASTATVAIAASPGVVSAQFDGNAALPATCIADAGPPAPEPPPRWRRLLPQLVVSMSYRPEHRRRADAVSESLDVRTPPSFDERSRHQGRFRWTVSLRWRAAPSSTHNEVPPASTNSDHLICRKFSEARLQRPTGLVDAIEQWTEVSRLRARIERPTPRGDTRE